MNAHSFEKAKELFESTKQAVEEGILAGGVDLSEEAREEEPQFLKDLGIVNRQTARRAGLRNPKTLRTMAVPKRRK